MMNREWDRENRGQDRKSLTNGYNTAGRLYQVPLFYHIAGN
jgi:hypothetical protein